ncbi:MAG TPA: FeoC-like transcriptional regulator [Halothiobacillus sp.]|jgi:hypothetical protein|nr:FeoC-like transcriptional regulator [Halothiobacillus sp.]
MTQTTTRHALTPSSLKAYLQQRGIAPFSDLVNRFDAPPGAVSGVLSFWQTRGKVRRIALENAASCDSGCSGCSTGSTDSSCATNADQPSMHDLYEWITPEAAPLDLDALSIYQHTQGI